MKSITSEMLSEILQGIAERRNTFIQVVETSTHSYARTCGISDISYLDTSASRTVLVTILQENQLTFFIPFVPEFAGIVCKELILLYMGAKWYWRDYYNRYTSLEAWGNSLVGKEIRTSIHGSL